VVYIGTKGINLLSLVAGFGDITPFVLNLLEGDFSGVTVHMMVSAILLATLSNNLIKMTYAIGFSGGRRELTKPLLRGFLTIGSVNALVYLLCLLF